MGSLVQPSVCTVIAGPNGSGKSSVYDLLEPPGEFVNADVIAREAKLGTIWAGRQAVARLRHLTSERETFVFETTLSGNQPIALMSDARRVGYVVDLFFVVLSSVDLHIRRVAGRVRMGGHDIPSADLRRRYPRSVRNLAKAIPLANTCTILDNSRAEPEVILRVRDMCIEVNGLNKARAHHISIAEAVAEAMSSRVDDLFKAAAFD